MSGCDATPTRRRANSGGPLGTSGASGRPSTWPVALGAALAVAGCAQLGDQRGTSGVRNGTVMGNYEAIASCVAEVDAKDKLSPPRLRIERDKKMATLVRSADEPKLMPYQLTFTQQGVSTVQVVGTGSPAPDRATRSLDSLWPNVAMCATNLTAP